MISEETMKDADLSKIAREGSSIYENIRSKYEPANIGKFLAIEIESRQEYIAETSADAMVAARKAHPGKIFYVVKIGFEAAETMAHLFPGK